MFPSDRGNVAKPARMALGSLIIQARCDYTNRELLQQITENPYLQYFIGLKEYQLTKPFTPVALVKFCKRFNAKRLAHVNEIILAAEAADRAAQQMVTEVEQDDDDRDRQNGDGEGNASRGKSPETKRPGESQSRYAYRGCHLCTG